MITVILKPLEESFMRKRDYVDIFPNLYEEELLYGALTRYHNRSCNKEFKDTLRDLYGDTRTYIMPDLIPDLKVLQNRLKYFNQFNINDCWEQHTFFHYYTNF